MEAESHLIRAFLAYGKPLGQPGAAIKNGKE